MGRNKTTKAVPQQKKLHKDPGVPKLIALKAKAEIASYKQKAQKQLTLTAKHTPSGSMDIIPSISTLAAMAAAAEVEEVDNSNETLELRAARIQKKQYIRTLHNVVDQSDIVIMVLDARDPQGCRSRMVEDEVRRRESDGKRLIFVLNKIDLVPKENAQAWLKYLRHTAPTLPFRSSTQLQRQNLSSRTSPALLNLLKSFKPPNRSISVGVVGYPNVGKSSLINSLKRARVCPVAAEPGWTKDLQSVAIERGLRIIDSPGVIFDDAEQSPNQPATISQASRILLLNVLSASSIPDPLPIIQSILSRTSHATIQTLYSLPAFDSDDMGSGDEYRETSFAAASKFLTMLALTTGRLLQGGAPNQEAAATQVLRDWNSGKIPYFTPVPDTHPSVRPSDVPGAEDVGDTKIVDTWKPAFDLGGLWDEGDKGAWEENDNESMAGDRFVEFIVLSKRAARQKSLTSASSPGHDEPLPSIPHKRTFTAQEEEASVATPVPSSVSLLDSTNNSIHDSHPEIRHPAKRIKHIFTYDMDLDDHEASTMANSNPMSRKKLRQGAKKGKKLMMRGTLEEGDLRKVEGMVIDV